MVKRPIGTIAYVANGSRGLFKEYVEVHQAGVTLTTFKIPESLRMRSVIPV